MQPKPRASREVDKFRALAREVIDRHFSGTKRINYLSGGLSNFVFSFANQDGEFVIRISPDPAGINLFLKEQWAVSTAATAGVPVPEILEVGTSPAGLPYMISKIVDGSNAAETPDPDLYREMGRIAARINSVKTKGFGQTFEWSDNVLSRNTTFKDWLEKEYDYNGKIELLERHKLLAPATAKGARKIFGEAAKTKTRSCLNHGDIRLKNMIGRNGKIAAVIDWEGCLASAGPAWDISIALHDLGIDEKQQFLEGYGMTTRKFTDILPLIKAFNLANYAPTVGEAAAGKDKKRMGQIRLRMLGAFDLYTF